MGLNDLLHSTNDLCELVKLTTKIPHLILIAMKNIQKNVAAMGNSYLRNFQEGLGLWCLTRLSSILQLYHGHQFYWWRKLEYPEKTTNLSKITDKLSHNVVSSTPRLSGIQTQNIGCDRH